MGQLIGSYGYCNKHGPYGGTRCTLCDKEHAETLQMIWDATMPQFVGIDWGKGKSWTGATTIMTAPTEEQLRDFDFWTREAPARATHCALLPSGEIEWQKRLPMRAVQRWSERLMLWEDIGPQTDGKMFLRPAKPAKEWDGEGLPPVGCECEYVPDPVCAPHMTVKGVFIGRVNGEDFVDTGLSVDRMKAINPARRFRPIRTKAEREREETVDEALGYLEYRTRNLDAEDELMKGRLNALYDAGMLRKGDS